MKTAKKLISLVMVMVTLVLLAVPASATSSVNLDATTKEALPNLSNISIRTYAKKTSGKIYCYNDSNLKTRGSGWIDLKNDECTILKVANSGKALHIKYPIGNGKTTCRWFSSEEFLGVNMTTKWPVVTVTKNMTTYKRSNGGATYGYAAAGDKVYVIGMDSNYVCIAYPLSAGGYKVGYVKHQAFQNSAKIISDMVDVTSAFAGKQVKIRSVQNGKYLCADSDQKNTPALCNKDKALNWETFTVTVTSDGWAGFKAHNGKWLSALNDVTNTPVRAIGNNLYSWECFKIYKKGSDYYIKAQVNSKYLCVRVDLGGAPVQSYASVASTWERFQIEIVSNNSSNISFTHPMKNYHKNYTQWGIKPSYRNGSTLQYHAGVDYMSNSDANIYAFTGGTVVSTGWQNANGYFILIEHNISGKTVYSFYGHLDTVYVSNGQKVSTGTAIGEVGKTGSAGGSVEHLHFAIIDYKWTSGGVYGYVTKFSGDKVTYDGVTYYNPYYVIANGKLP